MKKKILAMLFVCLFVLVPVLTGCAGGGGDKGKEVLGNPDHPFLPANKDWDGEVFNVLTKEDRTAAQAFNVVDLVADEENLTDPIQKAVYERNNKIEAWYNAKVERQAEADYQKMANNTDAYGEDFGAYMVSVHDVLDLALKGYVIDYNTANYIDLSSEWWDTSAIESLTVKGKVYFALGDINTVDDDATWCVLFNKAIRERYKTVLPNFYSAVNDGTWTSDNMKLWASKVVVEGATPDWNTTSNYLYGLYYQDECATVLLQASGNTPFTWEKNGLVNNNLTKLNVTDSIKTIKNLMEETATSAKWAQNINNISYSGGDVWEKIARGGFMADKALFFFCHCGTIQLIRSMNNDFGILPIPKLSETQKEYGNTIQYTNATCYVVPINSADLDFSCFMLEALGSLKAAYYDISLQRKASRDDESWEMLDIVYGNRIFDIACAMNIETINSYIVTACTTSNQEWSSIIGGVSGAINTQVLENIAILMDPWKPQN